MTPEDFVRAFAEAFSRQDAEALKAMLVADADVLTLTGAASETAAEARDILSSEFAGIFRAAKLVKGKLRQRLLGPISVVTQRFVVSGAQDEAGQDMPRFAAQLSAVLGSDGRALSLTFSATD